MWQGQTTLSATDGAPIPRGARDPVLGTAHGRQERLVRSAPKGMARRGILAARRIYNRARGTHRVAC